MARIIGALFAGGKGRRMGGADKASLILAGRPLYDWALARLRSQTDQIIVMGPSRPDWMGPDEAALSYVADSAPDGGDIGPAAGLLAALNHVERAHGPQALVFTAPVDAPFFPGDLCAQLLAGSGQSRVALAKSADGLQPAFALWRAGCADEVAQSVSRGERALHQIAAGLDAALVTVSAGPDGFLNINTPADLERAEALAQLQGRSES